MRGVTGPHDLTTPALVVDLDVLQRNIEDMAAYKKSLEEKAFKPFETL